MKIFDLNSKAECSLPVNAVMALGNFDGVHSGHRAILKEASYLASSLTSLRRLSMPDSEKIPSAVFTFSDLNRMKNVPEICSLDEKLDLFVQCGIDYAVVCNIAEVKELSPEEFVSLLADTLSVKHAVCGYNFTFAKNASGDCRMLMALLDEKKIGQCTVDSVMLDGENISSSEIRRLIQSGNVEKASKMLERPYSVRFKVLHGDEIGRTIGFPTVNGCFPENRCIPKHGVYDTEILLGGERRKAVTNIGIRPTVGGSELRIESHIIGFDREIYGEKIEVRFLRFLREEMKFASLTELKAQIKKDIDSLCE